MTDSHTPPDNAHWRLADVPLHAERYVPLSAREFELLEFFGVVSLYFDVVFRLRHVVSRGLAGRLLAPAYRHR